MKRDRKPRATRSPATHGKAAEWFALVAGQLEPAAASRLRRHAAACEPCEEGLAVVRRLAATLDLGRLEPVPPALRRAAEQLFAAHQPAAAPRRTRPGAGLAAALRRLVGVLRVEVEPAPFLPSALSARGDAAPMRCELQGGYRRVELEWIPVPGAVTLRGRVLPGRGRHPAAAGPIALLVEPVRGRPRRVQPNARGFFGPLRLPQALVRVTLETARGAYRSRWLPAERAGSGAVSGSAGRPSRSGGPRRKGPAAKRS